MRPSAYVLLLSAVLAAVPPVQVSFAQEASEFTFATPADAVSVRLDKTDTDTAVSYFSDGTWSTWKNLNIEDEQDPRLQESNLITFPASVTRIRIRGDVVKNDLHPITISKAPVRYTVAATTSVEPKILRRSEWGADESLLIRKENSSASSHNGTTGDDNNGSSSSQREKDCMTAQVNYPQDFKTAPTVVKKDSKGNLLRWPHAYSTAIKLLAVHHTAQPMDNENRSGAEMMRALYQYHAANRGWGDIGYHYVIDKDGQIFEGKAGGDFVVGGHAYCNNTSTIGVAMMGNFDNAKPPQAQMRALQWLLKSLADRYKIDTDEAVQFHGSRLPAIVGHRQLVSTDCPGEYVWRTLDQVRTHVASGDVNNPVTFPNLAQDTSTPPRVAPKPSAPTRPVARAAGFSALGGTSIEGRPGGDIIVPVLYKTDKKLSRGASLGAVWKSDRSMTVSQERGGKFSVVRRNLMSPSTLAAGESVVLRVKIHLPLNRDTFSIRMGSLTYTLTAEGRRIRGNQITSSQQRYDASLIPIELPTVEPTAAPATPVSTEPSIRIRLNGAANAGSITLRTSGSAQVNESTYDGQSLVLRQKGNLCEAMEAGRSISRAILRIRPANGLTTVTGEKVRQYRGVLECRVIDNALILINELSLEEYMQGLAEEPDTEPFEKQKAFAIAARTYAAWYMESDHRKFPNKPYDGSDSPAEFQVYQGVTFEKNNPRWLDAVKATAGQTLRFGGQLIKPPYFSSDDGRTRAPEEAGWKNFPFATIFSSKEDPWCAGMPLRGHGVGMSGCGAEAQANEGKTAEEILQYYYPGTEIRD